jgi:hypothetical protein
MKGLFRLILWPIPAVLVLLALVACGAGAPGASPAPSGPSGSLGVMTAEAGTQALAALCELRGVTDRDQANGLFFDHAHLTLHVLAAATEPVDRVPAAGLLEAKQVVEADLQADALPETFPDDVGALLEATRTALEAVGLPSPAC